LRFHYYWTDIHKSPATVQGKWESTPKLLRGIEKNAETTGLQGQKSRVLPRTARSQKGFTAHITGEAICAVRMVLSQRPLLADSVEKVGLWESCFLAVQKTLQFWCCCVKTKTAPSSAF